MKIYIEWPTGPIQSLSRCARVLSVFFILLSPQNNKLMKLNKEKYIYYHHKKEREKKRKRKGYFIVSVILSASDKTIMNANFLLLKITSQ